MKKAILYVTKEADRSCIDEICKKLEALCERELDFDIIEKQEIIGGFIAEIDDKIYDNSVKSRLDNIKKHLSK